ncbi:unnamed protein product [Phytophthora lilii]|uniref:Unnamed protein product n=1 Tax=Phytophthora lilii TaxID=2077276 RepID=A0A9W6THD6_9STRA|nr:unnamed protein product [Phytophthora lilii]
MCTTQTTCTTPTPCANTKYVCVTPVAYRTPFTVTTIQKASDHLTMSDSEDDAQDWKPEVELGFICDEPAAVDAKPLHCEPDWSKWDGGRVGGRPSWLGNGVPSAAQLSCAECGDPLAFLLQIYCPLDDEEDAFHRSLYVFVCRSPGCSRQGDGKAFRLQLPKDNAFYAAEGGATQLKAIGGQKPGEGEESDPFTDDSDLDVTQRELNEALGHTKDQDPQYVRFLTRVALAKDQVLRYSRWEDEAVLWVHSEGMHTGAVPPCERCGGERKFEFQVLPQLLNYLGVDQQSSLGDIGSRSCEWGTLAVYTCAKSCPLETQCAQEFLHYQPAYAGNT